MELSKKYDEFLYEKTQSKLFISISSKMYGLNVKYINTEKKVLAYKKSYKDSLELEKRCKELRLESDILNDKLMLIFSEAKDEFLNSIKK